ncbi:sigma-70 family RNA polymerase sigma factor [Microbacterium halotolerans]|uniref:sigma-70 family RNA polymerase sigma factor n=1 Tax=Microbacterium halotolerans TaxID=246613 RepID=UPI000E6AD5B9|nr:sigma-70 family RNA polymerase sigma factor [Microbacterium halotolerans]
MRARETDDNERTADADLVLRSRSGDADAFGELWRRHYRSGIVAARNISHDLDADDLVQEAYAKIFQAIRRGGGPTGSFRAYLFTAIRNIAATWGKAAASAAGELEDVEDPGSSEEAVGAALDHSLTVTAFRSLPSRWQEVLWYTEVENMKPAAVAPLLGVKPGAVSQLALRAREGLRESWIQAHIASVPEDSDCKWTIERIGAHTRGNLGSRDGAKADAHIASCPRCAIVASEAQDVGSRLVMVLLPLAVGVAGAGGYLASLQRGGEAVALMAMPQGVVEGASVIADESVAPDLAGHGAALFGHLVEPGAALIGAAAGAVGAAGAGSSGASSASSSAGGMLTVAGVATAGIASLAIAGVVAAAAVLPGQLNPPAEGTQSALQDSTSPTGAEIEPDSDLADASDESDGSKTPTPKPTPEKPTPTPKATEPTPEPTPQTPDASPEATTSSDEPPSPEPTTEPTPDPTTTATAPSGDDDPSEPEDNGNEEEVPLSTNLDRSTWNGLLDPTFTIAANAAPGADVLIRVEGYYIDSNFVEDTVTADEDGIASATLQKRSLWMSHDDPVIIELEDGSAALEGLTLGDFFEQRLFPDHSG